MNKSWKISYLIFGILLLIMVISIIPWENTFPQGPKVGVVEIFDTITKSKQVVKELNYFLEKSNIHAIVVRLDTPGGGVAASQEIYEKVKQISEKSSKPIKYGTFVYEFS